MASKQGLVHEFALSYSACFESEPDRIVYCEHGNQFDPANTFRDYADPLDTPLGDHVVTDLMPRLPGGRTLTPSLHLREVDRIFPLTEIPEWIAGRLFYDLVRQAIRWLLLPLLVAFVAYGVIKYALGGSDDDGLLDLLVDVGYDVVVLLVTFGLFVLILRRTANQAIRGAARRFGGDGEDPGDLDPSVDTIRRRLEAGPPPPLGDDLPGEIAVFVSGHTHAPSLIGFDAPTGARGAAVNSGWPRSAPGAGAFKVAARARPVSSGDESPGRLRGRGPAPRLDQTSGLSRGRRSDGRVARALISPGRSGLVPELRYRRHGHHLRGDFDA